MRSLIKMAIEAVYSEKLDINELERTIQSNKNANLQDCDVTVDVHADLGSGGLAFRITAIDDVATLTERPRLRYTIC